MFPMPTVVANGGGDVVIALDSIGEDGTTGSVVLV